MDARTIEILFSKFSLVWGTKWEKVEEKYGEMLAEEWREALAGLSNQAIKQGLNKTRQTCMWPPSIAEFLQACQGVEASVDAASHFSCRVSGCPNPGTMCSTTSGSNWVCNQHFSQGRG